MILSKSNEIKISRTRPRFRRGKKKLQITTINGGEKNRNKLRRMQSRRKQADISPRRGPIMRIVDRDRERERGERRQRETTALAEKNHNRDARTGYEERAEKESGGRGISPGKYRSHTNREYEGRTREMGRRRGRRRSKNERSR